eukprot:m.141577 g.141577  ORF g.141577 m.141577 type:complete len:135 (+) comp38348_c1_seq8:2754-3158(+)
MSTDIASVRLSTKPIHFTRSQSGWFFKADRTDKIGQYSGDVYDVHGLSVITRKRHANVFSHFYSNWTSDRREHLTDEDIQQNKVLYSLFTVSHDIGFFDDDILPGKIPRSLDTSSVKKRKCLTEKLSGGSSRKC